MKIRSRSIKYARILSYSILIPRQWLLSNTKNPKNGKCSFEADSGVAQWPESGQRFKGEESYSLINYYVKAL